jgi:hypothetical protein
MAHFAEIDSDNKVLRVLVVDNTQEHRGQEFLAEELGLGGTWIQTSYNATVRGKFAAIGDTYNPVADRFVSPAPFPSWVMDTEFNWNPPIPLPDEEHYYEWDEETVSWEKQD